MIWLGAPEEARALAPDEAAAWVVRLDDARLTGWLARSRPEPADLAEFASRADAAERLIRRRIARLLLGEAAGVVPAAVRLGRAPDGALRVDSPTGCYVSVAGQWPWCAVAVGRRSLGVDIEPVMGEPLRDDLLTSAERAWVAGSADRLRASLACWVAKEAHAKRLGRPRSLGPADVDTQPPGRAGLVRSGDDWSAVASAARDGWVAAVAVGIE